MTYTEDYGEASQFVSLPYVNKVCFAGVLQGLRYQLNPKAQTKLVRVTAGAIYNVIVDIRQGSPYLRTVARV